MFWNLNYPKSEIFANLKFPYLIFKIHINVSRYSKIFYYYTHSAFSLLRNSQKIACKVDLYMAFKFWNLDNANFYKQPRLLEPWRQIDRII